MNWSAKYDQGWKQGYEFALDEAMKACEKIKDACLEDCRNPCRCHQADIEEIRILKNRREK